MVPGEDLPDLDFLDVGDLQVIRERLDAYRRDYGDVEIVHDLEFLLDRLDRSAHLLFTLLDRAAKPPHES